MLNMQVERVAQRIVRHFPVFVPARSVSDCIHFNVNLSDNKNVMLYNTTAKTANGKISPRLKIPILKSSHYVGHYTSRVNRVYNEDKYSASVLNLPFNEFNPQIEQQIAERFSDKETQNIISSKYKMHENFESLQIFNFSVFDGHGSDEISQKLADGLADKIESLKQQDLTKDQLVQLGNEYKDYFGNDTKPGAAVNVNRAKGMYWNRWLKNVDRIYEKAMTTSVDRLDDLELRLLFAFLSMDLDLYKSKAKGGSTATSVFLYTVRSLNSNNLYFDDTTISKLVVSQLGDTKCIIVDKFGVAHSLTAVHHPDSPIETMRLRKYTSDFFVNIDSFGEERFLNFANTRAFGDFSGKSKGITSEPDINSTLVIGNSQFIKRQKNAASFVEQTVGGIGGDECFLVLMSDGITSMCSDQEVADLVMSTCNLKGTNLGTPQKCAEELVRYVEAIGGDDNATAMVVRLNGWGKWPIIDRTGKEREEKLNNAIFSRRM